MSERHLAIDEVLDAPPAYTPCCDREDCEARVQDEALNMTFLTLKMARSSIRAIHNRGIDQGCVPGCELCASLATAYQAAGESIAALMHFDIDVEASRLVQMAAMGRRN